MTLKLKACPFCGCKHPILFGNENTGYHIECPICGASAKNFECAYDPDGIDDTYNPIGLAEEAWNVRNGEV